MKNSMGDLHNHMMMQIERLSDQDFEGEALDIEVKRSLAMCQVADTIVKNARVILDAEKHVADYSIAKDSKSMKLLTVGSSN